jgi:hypothetical protein
MGDRAKLLGDITLLIITLLAGCLDFVVLWDSHLSQPTNVCGILPLTVFIVGVMAFTFSYVLGKRGPMGFINYFFGFHLPEKEILTCKHGHECEVQVQLKGRGTWHDFIKYGTTHNVDRVPKITPSTCPECGAHWILPHKHHHKSTTLDPYYPYYPYNKYPYHK